MPGSAWAVIDTTPPPSCLYVDAGCPFSDGCAGQILGTNIGPGTSISVALIAHGNYYTENLSGQPEFPMNCSVTVVAYETFYTNTTGAVVDHITVAFQFNDADTCAAFEAAGPCSLPGDWTGLHYRLGVECKLGSRETDSWLDATGNMGYKG